jgi:SAM-dependent methyltransferase
MTINILDKKEATLKTEKASRETIHAVVQAAYGAVARTGSKEPKLACCSADPVRPSDYSVEELGAVPKGAYLGEGSGAPVRYAELQPGEVVVDLGAGMDSFLAANRVAPAGRIYGYDLTPEMIERAQRNAATGNYPNVTFARADIERLPLASSTADAAISNCVINLAPDKPAVFAEIFRVLRPGGRMSVADIVLRGPREAVRSLREKFRPEGWCACVSGALVEKEYLAAIRAAGFADVRLVAERPAMLQPGVPVSAVAVTITARKPA